MACKAIQGFLYVFFDTQLSDVIKEKMKRLSVKTVCKWQHPSIATEFQIIIFYSTDTLFWFTRQIKCKC